MTATLLDGSIPAYWQSAECNTGDASLLDTFYPEHGGSYREARAICARCPVSAECLAHTMATEPTGHGSRHGMAAGLTPPERHRLAERSSAR